MNQEKKASCQWEMAALSPPADMGAMVGGGASGATSQSFLTYIKDKEMVMKKFISLLVVLTVVFSFGIAFANSSGSFNASYSSVTCTAKPAVFNPLTGTWTYPFAPAGYTLSAGIPSNAMFSTTLHMSPGNGTYAVVEPAFVTGLFTNTTLSTKNDNAYGSATADVGIQVCVNAVAPDGSIVHPQNISDGCVTYDRRIQQISNNLFQALSTCVTTVGCTSNAQCGAGTNGVCIIAPGAAVGVCGAAPLGQCSSAVPCPANSACTAIDPITGIGTCTSVAPSCSFALLQTTLSAHDYKFIFPINQQGTWNFVVSWAEVANFADPGSAVQACVGPGIVTVTQTKNFQNNGDVSVAY